MSARESGELKTGYPENAPASLPPKVTSKFITAKSACLKYDDVCLKKLLKSKAEYELSECKGIPGLYKKMPHRSMQHLMYDIDY